MASVVSGDYADAVNRIMGSSLFMWWMVKSKDGRALYQATDAHLLEPPEDSDPEDPEATWGAMAYRDSETGRIRFHSWMTNAINSRWHKLEDANPKYAVDGPRAIGTVPEAVLTYRERMRDMLSKFGKMTDGELDARLAAGESFADLIDGFLPGGHRHDDDSSRKNHGES